MTAATSTQDIAVTLNKVVFDVWHLNVFTVLIITAQLKDQCAYMGWNLLLRYLLHDLTHPAGRTLHV